LIFKKIIRALDSSVNHIFKLNYYQKYVASKNPISTIFSSFL
jgi:hypothetical protein